MLTNCLAVGCGGFLGAVARYLMGFLPVFQGKTFPIGTLCINVIGAFLIGIIASHASNSGNFDPKLLLFLKVGLCGGFTTFSTFSLEGLGLLESGRSGLFFLYAVLSVALCLLGVFLGKQVG